VSAPAASHGAATRAASAPASARRNPPAVRAPTARAARPRHAELPPLGSLNRLAVSENGGATLVGLALAGFVLVAGLVAVDVGALVSARAAVQTAADMAALAALTPLDPVPIEHQGAASPTQDRAVSRATGIAAANRAELVLCECSAVQAVVRVRRRVRLVPGGVTVTLDAMARAVLGPPPTTSRPVVPPADLLRAVDEDPPNRSRGVADDEAAGRPAGHRERRDGGAPVRGRGHRGPAGQLAGDPPELRPKVRRSMAGATRSSVR
jgi:Putative Flp pilus-assembly TadE/G-like